MFKSLIKNLKQQAPTQEQPPVASSPADWLKDNVFELLLAVLLFAISLLAGEIDESLDNIEESL